MSASVSRHLPIISQSRSYDDWRVGIYKILRRADKRVHRTVDHCGFPGILCVLAHSAHEFIGT